MTIEVRLLEKEKQMEIKISKKGYEGSVLQKGLEKVTPYRESSRYIYFRTPQPEHFKGVIPQKEGAAVENRAD